MDLEVGPADLARRATDVAAIDRLFDSLEFGRLRVKVREVSGIGVGENTIVEAVDPAASEAQVEVRLADDSCDVAAWANAHPVLALLVEGDMRPTRGEVTRIVLAGADDALVIGPAELSPAQEGALAGVLAQASSLITHDAKGARHALGARGWTVGDVAFDTMLAAYLVHPDQRSHKLEDVLSRLLGVTLEEEAADSDALFDLGEIGAGPSAAQVRAGRLAAALHPLADKLRQALDACREWQKILPEFKVNVNLSYVQVLKSRVLTDVRRIVDEFGVKPSSVCIELTESGYLEENERFDKVWNGLKEYGVLLALDDFGTGYSNLRCLSDLKPAYIKIDRSFTLKALNREYEYRLLNHIVEMSHSLGLHVCVEGIETEGELTKAKQTEPDYIQGFLFGKPCSRAEFTQKFFTKQAG